jgi:DNA-binding transcriptional MerR regulator
VNSQKLSGRKIPDREVAERYGVVARTLRRWEENPELGFPKALLINRRKYRDEDELIAWERARATQAA